VLKLRERTYHCESCGHTQDRDLNRCAGATAINLEQYPTVSYTGIACGALNNPAATANGKAVKQEANSSLDDVQICVGLA